MEWSATRASRYWCKNDQDLDRKDYSDAAHPEVLPYDLLSCAPDIIDSTLPGLADIFCAAKDGLMLYTVGTS